MRKLAYYIQLENRCCRSQFPSSFVVFFFFFFPSLPPTPPSQPHPLPLPSTFSSPKLSTFPVPTSDFLVSAARTVQNKLDSAQGRRKAVACCVSTSPHLNMERNRPGDHLGVNRLGKNIRKSPLHQPSFPNHPSMATAGGVSGGVAGGVASGAGAGKVPVQQQQPQPPPPPQPQVYNISKNDFRSMVQHLTGSPSHDRSAWPPPAEAPAPAQQRPQNLARSPSLRLQKIRPPPLSPIARPPIPIQPPPNPAAPVFGRPPEESPISAYMRYLQNSIVDTAPHRPPAAPPQHPPPSSGILPTPAPPQPPPGPSPWPVLPSPTALFGVPSPSSFLNMTSPRSPYPLLSPGFPPYPSPLTPNFGFSAFAQSPGILGPGPFPPPSPGLLFPPSPGFLPIFSPRWRE